MAQRHPNDDTVTDPEIVSGNSHTGCEFLIGPPELRQAYSELGADVEEDFKRALYTEITEPWMRTFGRQHVILNHRSSEDDFATALHWLKLDEAARRVARENERRVDHERDQRAFTCKLCGRYDGTANNSVLAVANHRGFSVVGVPAIWCLKCRTEWDRQELAEHAAFKVGDSTVAALIAAARKAAAP